MKALEVFAHYNGDAVLLIKRGPKVTPPDHNNSIGGVRFPLGVRVPLDDICRLIHKEHDPSDVSGSNLFATRILDIRFQPPKRSNCPTVTFLVDTVDVAETPKQQTQEVMSVAASLAEFVLTHEANR